MTRGGPGTGTPCRFAAPRIGVRPQDPAREQLDIATSLCDSALAPQERGNQNCGRPSARPRTGSSMDFVRYYRTQFRDDLEEVVKAGAPSLHPPERDVVIIQPRTLSALNSVIESWTPERQMAFASGLYLTVLADEVCYTYFHLHYADFRRLKVSQTAR